MYKSFVFFLTLRARLILFLRFTDCVFILQPTKTVYQIWYFPWRVSGWSVLAMTRVWAGCAPKVAACWEDTTSLPGPLAYSILLAIYWIVWTVDDNQSHEENVQALTPCPDTIMRRSTLLLVTSLVRSLCWNWRSKLIPPSPHWKDMKVKACVLHTLRTRIQLNAGVCTELSKCGWNAENQHKHLNTATQKQASSGNK